MSENNLFEKVYNPDVLTCLANLSNDEVFTPPEIVNQMLDLLPQELFSNPDTKFLDPACKTGVFLREIAKRLIKGLAWQIPNLQERIDHIFKNQLYGIAITELTSLLSRRGVYCSKYPNSEFSVTMFDTPEGNIRFRRINHTWKNGKCIFCGANQEQYDRGEQLETHAYEFIHTLKAEELFNMKFDVIIGNPPYQLSDGSGGSSDSAMPIYNRFITQAKKLSPKYLVMIVPSKWMVGGRGLNTFRQEMLNDYSIKYIFDFENSSDCFAGIHLDGGVCYILWDKGYCGKTNYTYVTTKGERITSLRYLKNDISNYVIRDSRILSIIDKTKKDNSFASIVYSVRPFGIRGFLFNEPDRYPNAKLSDQPFSNSLKVYGVKGIKGGAKRTQGYITRETATINTDIIDKYKVFFTTSYSTNATIPPEPILAFPNEICTETFLLVGNFNTQNEAENCITYIKTNFFRFLLFHGKGTMHVNKEVFALIPLQDFSKPWTDEELYAKYGLSQEEIDFIESMIKPME